MPNNRPTGVGRIHAFVQRGAYATAESVLSWAAGIASAYATYVGVAWCRYGHAAQSKSRDERDKLLDRFMPVYEAGGRHQIRVAAPAAITLAAARDMDLFRSPVARAIFRGRELIVGATADNRPRPPSLLAGMQAIGWGVLAEIPDREIIVGAVTQPWKANVVFRALPPNDFVAFDEPDYVKIVWTLRADPIECSTSLFRTETRVTTTDTTARKKFRWYWSFFSPGMFLIRWVSLSPLKAEAERRAEAADTLQSNEPCLNEPKSANNSHGQGELFDGAPQVSADHWRIPGG